MMNRNSTSTPDSGSLHAGFSLIELLVVIIVISLLLSITAATGMLVVKRQNASATMGVLSSLDRLLEEVITEEGAPPPYNPYDPNIASGNPNYKGQYHKAPGDRLRYDSSSFENTTELYQTLYHSRHPDASVFLRQAIGIGESDAIISNIGDRFLAPTPTSTDTDVTPSVLDTWGDLDEWAAVSPASANDPANAWPALHPSAHLIFYVHPSNRLAQDLYGKCLNGRPYFFSAGPDGNYGTTSQLTPDGDTDQNGAATSTKTFSEVAIESIEDNLYSYSVDPWRSDPIFNASFR